MANGFNVDLRPTPDPNYLGSSKEPSRLENRNDTYANLFAGVTDAGNAAVSAVDGGIKEKIKTDVYAQMDPIRNAQGVQTATDAQPDPLNITTLKTGAAAPEAGADRPPNVDELQGRLGKLTAAFKEGKISDTNYYAQLEAETRKIRSRFPGYREDVDAMVQSVTGVTPANALRRSVLSDLEAAKSADQKAADDQTKWFRSNLPYMTPQQRGDFASGKALNIPEVTATIGDRQAQDASVSSAKSQLDLSAAQGKATKEQAADVADQGFEQMFGRMFVDGNVAKMINDLTEKQKQGINISPEDQNKIKGGFLELKNQTSQTLDKFLATVMPGSKKSVGEIMGYDEAQKFRETKLKRFDQLQTQVSNGEFGMVSLNARMVQASTDSNVRNITEKYPVLKNINDLGQMKGMSEVVKVWATQGDSPMMSQSTKAVADIFRTDRAVNGTNFMQHLKDAQNAKGRIPGATKKIFNDTVEDLTNPGITPEVLKNTVKSVFSQDNKYLLEGFEIPERPGVFMQLTKPEVSKRILDTMGKDSPEWKNYSSWAKSSMLRTFKSLGDDIDDVSHRDFIGVKFDEKANRFIVSPTAEGVKYASKQGGRGNVMDWLENNLGVAATEKVDKMNGLIARIEPIMKTEGYDVGQEMGGLLRGASINPDGSKEKSIWQTFRGAWNKARESNENTTPKNMTPQTMADDMTFGGENTANFSRASGGENTGGLISLEQQRSLKAYLGHDNVDVTKLHPTTAAMLAGIKDIVPGAIVSSGHRDAGENARAGGADHSQHLDGRALDFNVRDMPDTQKAQILEAAIAKGAKGIGIYPNGSIHVDTRSGAPATWGIGGSYRGADWRSQPAWAQPALRKLFSSS
jgi:uncharacterized protein YcbK (DUF882 family)